jgi:hypothetical protein
VKVVLAHPDVPDLIRARGGRIYVWTYAPKCCSGNVTYLATGTEPEPDRTFHRIDADGFELFFAPGRMNPPDSLVLDVKGRRNRRVEAYWDGCVFAV